MPNKNPTIETVLHIFSGRPDPRWVLSEAQVAELRAKLDSLPPCKPKRPPGLGYRGVRVINVSKVPIIPERIIAYSGVLAITDNGTTSYHEDLNNIEEILLKQAREKGYDKIIDEALQYSRKLKSKSIKTRL